MTVELKRRLQVAEALMARAGAEARRFFEARDSLVVETKAGGPQDVVSLADRAVEALIRAVLAEAFPGDGVLGEEHGAVAGQSEWTWVIDPIDGTAPFLHGLISWSVVIALCREGRCVAGFVAWPMVGRLYVAVEGRGAFCREGEQETRLSVSAADRLDEGIVAVGAGGARYAAAVGGTVARLMQAGASFMRNGSAALSLAHVAAGHYLAFYEPELSAWDCLAGQLLVREAGGVSSAFVLNGERQPVVGAAPGVAPALLDLLPAPAPELS